MAEDTQTPNIEQSDRVVVQSNKKRFDISEFRSEINKNGVLQNNKFICVIALPKAFTEGEFASRYRQNEFNFISPDFITLRCETVTIPGQNFFTQDLKRYGYGQIEKKPYLPSFNPMRMVFLVDRSAKIIKFFNDWANLMIDHNVDKPIDEEPQKNTYLVNYKSEYICPVLTVFVYNDSNELVFSTKAFDCFPLTISEYDVSWASQNDVIRLSISMQFVHSVKEFYDKGSETESIESRQAKSVLNSDPVSRFNPDVTLNRNEV